MIYTSCLSAKELEFLNLKLSENKGMSDLELDIHKHKHPNAVDKYQKVNLILTDMKLYGQHDNSLNSFILNKFGKHDYCIDFFYELIYDTNDYTNPHLDKDFSQQTTIILLSDNFTGGELILDGKDVKLNKRGKYISFSGNTTLHSVNKVLSGQRRVLVIMFNKKQTIL